MSVPALPDSIQGLVNDVSLKNRGALPIETKRLHSVCNDVFRLTFADARSLILKIYSRGHGADRQRRGDRSVAEQQAIALLASHHLPVPPVFASDISADTPWLLMQDVGACAAGRPEGLSSEEAKRVYRRCGELLASVHRISPRDEASALHRRAAPGDTGHVTDPVLRWALGRAKEHALSSPDLLQTFRTAATAFPACPVLCHGDFHPDQCVRDGATVSALVDWESATFGDATADHAKLANYLHIYFAPDLAAETLAGYASLTPPPAPNDPHYLALRALHAVALCPAERSGDSYALAWWDLAATLTQKLRG